MAHSSYDHRNVGFHCLAQYEPRVPLHHVSRTPWFARPQIKGARIAGTCVATYKICPLADCMRQSFVEETRTKVAGCSDCSYALVIRHCFGPSPEIFNQLRHFVWCCALPRTFVEIFAGVYKN